MKRIGHAEFDPLAFTDALRQELISGQFVFMYVARDLDARTERVMGYLAETSKMWFFAVEVDCFRDPETMDIAAIVPRTRFVPPWVFEELSGPGARSNTSVDLQDQSSDVRQFVSLLDSHAMGLGLSVENVATGRAYKLPSGSHVLGVYWGSGRGLEFNLEPLRQNGRDADAEKVLDAISLLVNRKVTAKAWPAIPLVDVAARPDAAIRDCIDPFLRNVLSNALGKDAPR